MFLVNGEFRKLISFKSKEDKEFYKIKMELENFDIEVFVPSKYYNEISNLESLKSKNVTLHIYINTSINKDNTKAYLSYVLAEFPKIN